MIQRNANDTVAFVQDSTDETKNLGRWFPITRDEDRKGILVSLNLIDNGFRGELFAVAHNFTNITDSSFVKREVKYDPHLFRCVD